MALDQAGVELIAKGAQEFVDAMGRARDAQGRFLAGVKDAETQTSGGGGSFSTIAMAAANFVGTMAVQAFNAATQAARDFIGGTLTVAADYESTMKRFASVTGDAVTDAGMKLEDFNQLFLDMGAKTQFSAAEAAEAAVNLAKGGLDPATIAAGGLEGAMALAAAGELDLAQAAEITAKQLGVWGDEAGGAGHVADRLAQAANASTVDVDDLAIGLANAGAAARGSEVSFDDMVQTMALIAPGFTSGATAGTGYANFLSRMNPTSEDAKKAMVELGLATEDGNSLFYDAQGNFIGMRKAAQLLQDSLGGLSAAQRSDALQTIFGNDAKAAALILAEQGAAGFDAMGVAMGNAGTAAEQAAERNKGLNFALESLKGSWETIQIVLGTALLPLLTQFLETAVIPLANAVLAFAQENMPALTAALSGAQTSVQPLVDAFTSLVNYFAAVVTDGDTLNDWLTHLPEPMQPIVTKVGELLKAFQDNIPLIQTYIGDMKSTVTTAGEEVSKVLGADLTATLTTAKDFWQQHSDEVMAILNGLWRLTVAIASTSLIVLSATVDIGLKVVDGLFDAFEAARDGDWTKFWTSINATADTSFDSLTRNFAGWLDTMIRTFSGGTMQLDETWKKSLLGLRTNLELTSAILNLKIAQMLTSLYYTALANLSQFITVGEQIVRGMILGVTNIAGELGRAAAQAALDALNAAKAALGIHSPSTAFEFVGQMSSEGFIQGLQNSQRDLARAAGAIFGDTARSASRSVSSVSNTSYSTRYGDRNYNLSLNTRESTGNVRRDFGVMELLAG